MKKTVKTFAVLIALSLIVLTVPQARTNSYFACSDVYVGGYAVGLIMDIDGVSVEENCGVETEYGVVKLQKICAGDIIMSVNGSKVTSCENFLSLVNCETATIELQRNGVISKVEIAPIKELYTNSYRVGLKIIDKINGVGTVSFVNKDGSFAALGHEIVNSSGYAVPICGGGAYECKLLGVKKGEKGEAGVVLASIDERRRIGDITIGNSYGIYGNFYEDYMSEVFEMTSRDEVKAGKAQIVSFVSGKEEKYDIEIIRASHQSKRKTKGMVIRVTDKRLLDISGGIVRGMSGSPIIQNGRLVGAVTHVLLNDSTKGYGVYAEFMSPV